MPKSLLEYLAKQQVRATSVLNVAIANLRYLPISSPFLTLVAAGLGQRDAGEIQTEWKGGGQREGGGSC